MSISISPVPAPLAIRQIGLASGRRLGVAPALADEVLFARLKEAPVDTALSHIAEVLCAKWLMRRDGVAWLEPDPKAVSRIEESEAEEEAHRLQDSFKYLHMRIAQQPQELDQKAVDAYIQKKRSQDQSISDAEARRDFTQTIVGTSARQESPAWRALARIVLQMDPKVLLAIQTDAREVWAENPTPMQHEFSDEAKDMLKIYRRELSILDPSLVAKRIKVIFRKLSIMSEFVVNFEAAGLDGKQVDRSVAMLNSYADRMKTPSSEPSQVDSKPGQAILQPSAETIEARKAQATFYEGADRKAVVAKWRPRFLDPVRYEPTKWDIGEELMLAAESVDRNLVGSANDVLIGGQERFTKATADQVLRDNRESLLPSADGWLVYRSHERIQRSSRSKARSLLASCIQAGGITVDLAANWSAQSTDRWPFMNWICNYVCQLFTYAGQYGALSTMMNPYGLSLWSDLGSTGIESLRNGGVLQLSRLSPAAKAQIERMVYSSELDDGDDPTDRLPNGITDGTLTMTIDEMPVFYGWTSSEGPPVAPEPVDANEFGSLLAKGQPWKEVPAAAYQKFDRFRVAVHRKYKFNFLIEPGPIPMTAQVTETLFNPNIPEVLELPADLKAAVEKARLSALAAPAEAVPKRVIPPR